MGAVAACGSESSQSNTKAKTVAAAVVLSPSSSAVLWTNPWHPIPACWVHELVLMLTITGDQPGAGAEAAGSRAALRCNNDSVRQHDFGFQTG